MAEVFQKGTLYLCATPIGNLEDITYRVVRCLREADVVAAEDTRHTKQLLAAYDIDTPLTSYHEHNKAEKGPQLIDLLRQGQMVALVSDAGMPAICDPGSDLVRLAIEDGIPIVPLPGANAGLTGLIASGMDTTRFTFIGFLPKTQKRAGAREALRRDAHLLRSAPSHPDGTPGAHRRPGRPAGRHLPGTDQTVRTIYARPPEPGDAGAG